MNVLSLFDGMSCGRIALDRLGMKVNNYFACEIDKFASGVTKANWPNTIHLGDVCKVDTSKLPKIDLLIGGSPCQSFSHAGDGSGFDGKSKLFFEYVRILEELKKINPNIKFMLENVCMKKEWEDTITFILGVEPIFINSALVSAQNRKRLYWCNWSNDLPEDKEIVLKDILECGIVDRDKSHCLDANYFKGGNLKSYFEKHRRQLVFDECIVSIADLEPCTVNKPRYELERRYGFKTWRSLTPIECERLQTVDDNYTSNYIDAKGRLRQTSKTQRYKMLGNGWTVDVIVHLLNDLMKGGK